MEPEVSIICSFAEDTQWNDLDVQALPPGEVVQVILYMKDNMEKNDYLVIEDIHKVFGVEVLKGVNLCGRRRGPQAAGRKRSQQIHTDVNVLEACTPRIQAAY